MEYFSSFVNLTPWALLSLRVVLGAIFIAHGKAKLVAGPAGMMGGMLKQQGFPMPVMFAWIVGLGEFVGGILLVLGLFMNPVTIFFIILMLVATYMKIVSWKKGLVEGYEFDILIIAGMLILLAQGTTGVMLGDKVLHLGIDSVFFSDVALDY